MRAGPVRYARNGSVRLAYRVIGDADVPLVLVPGWVSSVDVYDDPTSGFTTLAEQLATSTRFVVWDKRGTGLSDPVTGPPALDERMDDLRAVMDAAEVDERAPPGHVGRRPDEPALRGDVPGTGPVARALRHRARASPAIRRRSRAASRAAEIEAQLTRSTSEWGEGRAVRPVHASRSPDVDGVPELLGAASVRGASPTMAKHLLAGAHGDRRPRRAGSVQAPHAGRCTAPATGSRPRGRRRAGGRRSPNATLRELPPGDHLACRPRRRDRGVRSSASSSASSAVAPPDERVLATVLFTDIVGFDRGLSRAGGRALAAPARCPRRDRRAPAVGVRRSAR